MGMGGYKFLVVEFCFVFSDLQELGIALFKLTAIVSVEMKESSEY